MQIIRIIFLVFFVLTSCRSKPENAVDSEVRILNDAFMDMIGTVPYKYHSLRPAPNDSVYTDMDSFNVAITPSLVNIRKWEKEIIALSDDANNEDKKHILALFEKSKFDSLPLQFPVDQFKKTERYRLFPYTKRSFAVDTLSAIGKVEFTRTYFDDEYAITVATIRDHIKNGIVKLFLIEKKGITWNKKQEFILEIW